MASDAATGRSFRLKTKTRLQSQVTIICKRESRLRELTLMEGITLTNGGRSVCG